MEYLSSLTLETLLESADLVVSPDTGVGDVLTKLASKGMPEDFCVAVVADGRLQSLLTPQSALAAAHEPQRPVGEVAAAPGPPLTTTDSALAALTRMGEQQRRRLPVVDAGGRFRGLVSWRGIQWAASSAPLTPQMLEGPVLWARPTVAVKTLAKKMAAQQASYAVIGEAGEPQGVVTTAEILRLSPDLFNRRAGTLMQPPVTVTLPVTLEQCRQRFRETDAPLLLVVDPAGQLQGGLQRTTFDNGAETVTPTSPFSQRLAREQLVAEVTRSIRQSLELDEVLQQTVVQVRRLLSTDRVILYRFHPDWQGTVVTESVGPNWLSILSTTIYDPCFGESYVEPYRKGRVSAIANMASADIEPCYRELLSNFQVQASLVVPVLQNEALWGLLVVHHCRAPRDWQKEEVELLKHLADQLSIAIRQSELYQQTRRELLERRQMQAALQESEARFRSLSTSAPVGIRQVNPDGICLYVNARWQQMSGLSFSDSLGDGWLSAVHPQERLRLRQAWEAYLEGGEPIAQEFRLLTAAGEMRWVLAQAAAIYSDDGEIIGYVDVTEDITDRKQRQEQLQLLELAVGSISEAVIITATAGYPPHHRIVYVNPAFTAMSGHSADEVLGRSPRLLQGPSTDPVALDQLKLAIAEQRPVQLEMINYRKDGSEFWVELSMVPLVNGGGLSHWVSVRRDITVRRQSEQKIHQQAALLDIATDAIWVHDLGQRIVFWSRGAERLYGWSRAEALGKQADAIASHESESQLQAANEAILSQGFWQGELAQVTHDGRGIMVSSRRTLVRDNAGQPQAVLVVNTDITEKKQLESQFYRAQRLESLGTLASGIAHDLNNVFTPMLTIAQLLPLRQELDESSLRLLEMLTSSTRRGIELVKQVLVFARGSEGRPVTLQPEQQLRELSQLLRETFPKSIQIRLELPDRPLPQVCLDPTQLHQVLMNLCVNSRDAMATGGTLTLGAHTEVLDAEAARRNLEARPGPYLVLTVMDTGEGIPSPVMDRIFEPFYTTKGTGQGTGLGLSTVLGIVRNLGGFVQVASEVGRGTEFQVYLPASAEAATATDGELQLLPRGQGELILVVEDEAMVRQTTQTLLEQYGYRTLLAADGLEAVEMFTEPPAPNVAAVVMDMMMPAMDGPTAIRALRRLQPEIKVLAASGLSNNRKLALAAGAEEFLGKPYTAQALLRTLHQVLRQPKAE